MVLRGSWGFGRDIEAGEELSISYYGTEDVDPALRAKILNQFMVDESAMVAATGCIDSCA